MKPKKKNPKRKVSYKRKKRKVNKDGNTSKSHVIAPGT